MGFLISLIIVLASLGVVMLKPKPRSRADNRRRAIMRRLRS